MSAPFPIMQLFIGQNLSVNTLWARVQDTFCIYIQLVSLPYSGLDVIIPCLFLPVDTTVQKWYYLFPFDNKWIIILCFVYVLNEDLCYWSNYAGLTLDAEAQEGSRVLVCRSTLSGIRDSISVFSPAWYSANSVTHLFVGAFSFSIDQTHVTELLSMYQSITPSY